ncbi:MAG: efflux RND transporter periplasmic adaptor subunit [Bacteroidota bacterium]|nr:efflux RND transporter periplasmic adaptor subunit [Bacteroidota bacterium]
MSRFKSWLIAGMILIAAGAITLIMVLLRPDPVQTEPPPQRPFARTATITVGTGPVPVYGAGTVRPTAEINIAPQVGGRVDSVAAEFKSGSQVILGQPLFWIEPDDYAYRVEEAEAGLAARRVALLEEQQRAAIARSRYEQYAEGRNDAAVSPLTLRQPQLEAAIAAVRRDSARLAGARLALSRTLVTAPFNGIVRHEQVDAGQIVMAGQPVGQLFASDAAEVVVPLSDTEAALIPNLWATDRIPGALATVTLQHGANHYTRDGYVDRAEAFLDVQTRTVDVIVRVPRPFSAGAPPLLVGEFVEVTIEGLAAEPFYTLPRAALHPDHEVWVVQDGTVHIVRVEVLQRADDRVFVTGPLADGDTVITGGIQYAVEGMLVLTETGLAQ